MAVKQIVDDAVVDAWNSVSAAYQSRYAIPVGEIHLGPMVPTPADLGIQIEPAGAKILDFGCGAGQNAIACSLGGAREVMAIDPSERQLELGRAAASAASARVEFVRLDGHGLRELPTDFDLVLSVYALQFVPDVTAVMLLLAERLRIGGRLLISVDHPMRLSGEWHDDAFLVENYFARCWQSWPYDFPEAGITVDMRRYLRPLQDWVNALLNAPLALRGLYEPQPATVADSFGRQSKYGVDDPRNVFHPDRLTKVPGSLILLAERLS